MTTIDYRALTPNDFAKVIQLANHVHGDGYMNENNIQDWYQKGFKEEINAGFVAYDGDKLVGFRITYAAEQWHIDKWCSPQKWQADTAQVCYFKCNTVDENYRGYGIGSELLKLSIAAAKQQGAIAGVSHLWKQSPGNSAVKYFTKCGGELVQSHPDKWREDALNGYDCILCGFDCHCEAAEMIIYFD
ncbi:GNAT family N-acetyltransferase [Thalassotalea euphylliae]|uniref:GNAT family N-acetyltransferase n=1 Tax=Thalassotalea euphylliae TaxID=1655234 RepID=A0A3E0U0M8_9GAMM|nr:GNAT family N-acetyltransferase [Thalassotalea euphylliae]REL30498.1 GNAT family N-acetyltransferase [Thalassotalea euphylliae]